MAKAFSINSDYNGPPAISCFQKTRFPIAIAVGIIVALGGVFLTLAAHQILPSGMNVISSLGVDKVWYGIIGLGAGVALAGLAGWSLCQDNSSVHDNHNLNPTELANSNHVPSGSSKAIYQNPNQVQNPEALQGQAPQPKFLFEGSSLDDNNVLNFAEILVDGKPQLVVVKHGNFDKKYETDNTAPSEALYKMAQGMLSACHSDRHWGAPIKHLLNYPSNTILDAQTFLNYLLEREPSGTPRIMTLNAMSLIETLEIAKAQNVQINLHECDPVSGDTLFSKWAGEGNLSLTKAMLELDPTVIQQSNSREESFFAKAVRCNEPEEALLLLQAMENASLTLSDVDLWVKRAFTNDTTFKDAEFIALSRPVQDKIYRIANIYVAKDIVLRLNNLGMKEELLPCTGPQIISANMDVICVRTTLKNFLQNLRKNDLLLTKEEFSQKDKSKYINKTDQIGRILGRNYIEDTAKRLGLKHMKVPKKFAVIEKKDGDADPSVISIEFRYSLEPKTENLVVYAERIVPVNRKLSKEELLEFLTLIEATGFNDFDGDNFIIAADGVYAIDTEYRNFSSRPTYNDSLLQQLGRMVAEEDLEWLNAELQKRLKEHKAKEEDLNQKRKEQNQIRMAKLCAYGFDSRSKPFNFKIDKILAAK